MCVCLCVQVFAHDMDKESLILAAARASRIENQDAIDASIVGMLGDAKEARAGITEVHFLPFNPVEKRTAITYIDSQGNWHRDSKGAPEQVRLVSFRVVVYGLSFLSRVNKFSICLLDH